MTITLIIFGFIILIWGTINAIKAINDASTEPEPTQERQPPQMQPAPKIIQEPQPAPVAPIPAPQPEPTPEPVKTENKTPSRYDKMDRKQLEQAARNCLTASGCKFDVYDYTRFKRDNELIEIINDYNNASNI